MGDQIVIDKINKRTSANIAHVTPSEKVKEMRNGILVFDIYDNVKFTLKESNNHSLPTKPFRRENDQLKN